MPVVLLLMFLAAPILASFSMDLDMIVLSVVLLAVAALLGNSDSDRPKPRRRDPAMRPDREAKAGADRERALEFPRF